MKVKHLDHLNLSVKNFDETHAWYAKVFGFELVEEGVLGGRRWGVLKSGEAMLCIYETLNREFYNSDALRNAHIHGINHFALRVEDRAVWEAKVREGEVVVDHMFDYPHSRSWYVNDPTGYEIEVVSWNENTVKFG